MTPCNVINPGLHRPASVLLLSRLLLLTSLGPLGEIDANQDFRCFPKLYKVDDVLVEADYTAWNGKGLSPSEAGDVAGLKSQRLPERRADPFHEVKRDVEELVPSADYEEHGLKEDTQ